MAQMTAMERITRMLKRQKADRIGVYEAFWGDTHADYVAKGHIDKSVNLLDHFDLDIRESWAFTLTADLDFKDQTVEENEDTRLVKNGNGAILRWHKHHASTPENVSYTVQNRATWNEVRDLLVNVDERRINFEGYRNAKARAKEKNKFFTWSGPNVFEYMHPICGHEHMLMGMAEDPEWITDMATVYSDLIIALQEILFDKEGPPDGVYYYEDMGFKARPFMSPRMYRELLFPAHKKTCDFAKSRNLPVIMHSCGYIEPLLPDMIKAGIDALQAIEIKAGMDLLKVYKDYGDVLSLLGGLDVRVLYSNDKNAVAKMLDDIIPVVKQGFGYCLFSDHSIPNTVEYETYKFFLERGLELGKY
jgi:uroporphyrinogen decarboxylase